MHNRKRLLLLTWVLILILVSVGCGNKDNDNTMADLETNEAEINEIEDMPTDEGFGTLRYAIGLDGKLINPHEFSTSSEASILDDVAGKLYNTYVNADGTNYEMRAELADGDPIQVDDEGKVWQIKINKDAKWENGEPINADTFMYSYKMLLDPKLLNRRGANFAQGNIIIENANEYYLQLTDETIGEVAWEDVGIKKIDDYTIEITSPQRELIENVKTHFSTNPTSPVYEELYEKLMNEDRTETSYGADIDSFMSSGPFILDKWLKDSEKVLKKNPYYVNKDLIWLAEMNVKVVPDAGTRMQLFENGEIDYVGLSAEDFEKFEEDPRVLYSLNNGIRYISINSINPDQPILSNKNFRKAFFYAVDRKAIADLTHHVPANYIYSSRLIIDPEAGIRWRDTDIAKAYLEPNYGYDPELALEYFEKALEEEGLDKVTLTLNYNDANEDFKKKSEYLQNSLPQIFGKERFELKLQAMPSNTRIANMEAHQSDPRSYELSWSGWVGNEFTPWNTMRVFTSDFNSKHEPFSNERLDELIHEVNFGVSRYDQDAKIDITAELEQIILEELPIIPVVEPISKYLKSDRVQLPVKEWLNGVGFGWKYSKIVE